MSREIRAYTKVMESKVVSTRHVGGIRLEVVHGDMTRERVDAIVNAANSSLAHGGGLAGAIVRTGGSVIQEESSGHAPVPVGGAVVTSAGKLPCRWVIHAVGPRWGEGDEEAKLHSAVRSALVEAEGLGVKTLALPAISTGIFGYPRDEGCRHIVEETAAWLRDSLESGISQVRFTAFDRPTVESFVAALEGMD